MTLFLLTPVITHAAKPADRCFNHGDYTFLISEGDDGYDDIYGFQGKYEVLVNSYMRCEILSRSSADVALTEGDWAFVRGYNNMLVARQMPGYDGIIYFYNLDNGDLVYEEKMTTINQYAHMWNWDKNIPTLDFHQYKRNIEDISECGELTAKDKRGLEKYFDSIGLYERIQINLTTQEKINTGEFTCQIVYPK